MEEANRIVDEAMRQEASEFTNRLRIYLASYGWHETDTGKFTHQMLHPKPGLNIANAVFTQIKEEVRQTNGAERISRSLRGARVIE